MTQWASGDSLTPSTLNRKLTSAVSVGGFSSNTLRAEVGTVLAVDVNTFSVGTGAAIAPGGPALLIAGNFTGTARDLLSIEATVTGAGNPRGISNYPTFNLTASNQLVVPLASGGQVAASAFTGAIYYGVQSFGPTMASGSLSTNVGVWVDDASGASSNFGLYTGKGQNRFGDTSRFTDGAALAPSIAMDSEVSLGFYRSAASTIALSYGVLKVSQLSTSGNVILGGSLQVTSGATITGAGENISILGGNGGSGTGQIKIGALASRPTVALANSGGILFVQAGALLFLGGSGSLTTIAVA